MVMARANPNSKVRVRTRVITAGNSDLLYIKEGLPLSLDAIPVINQHIAVLTLTDHGSKFLYSLGKFRQFAS